MVIAFIILSIAALYFYRKIVLKNFSNLVVTDDKRQVCSGAGVILWDLYFLIFIYLFLNFNFDKNILITILPASFSFTLFGWADDFMEFSPKPKLLGQVVIAFSSLLLFVYVEDLSLNWLTFSLLAFLLVWFVNALNFIDILDGLLSGVIIIILFSFYIFCYFSQFDLAYSIIFLMIPVSVFFIHNVNKPKVYLGDAGAHFFGCLLYFISLHLYFNFPDRARSTSFIFLVFGFIFFDFLFVCLLRTSKSKSLFMKSQDHLMFFLLKKTNSKLKTLSILLSCQILVSLLALIGTLYLW